MTRITEAKLVSDLLAAKFYVERQRGNDSAKVQCDAEIATMILSKFTVDSFFELTFEDGYLTMSWEK